LEEFDNLVILRSFSKNFGLAGLRLGFAISTPENAKELERKRQIFNVNRLAEIAGREVLNHLDYYKGIWNKVAETREVFIERIKMLGLMPFESYTNFVLVKFKNRAQMQNILEGLRKRNIYVLKADDEEFTGLRGAFLRFTIGTDDEMRKVTQILDDLI